MAGFLPNEGRTLVANLVFKDVDADRGSSLMIGLFTNTTTSVSTAWTDITQPTGGDYAEKPLADISWTVTNDLASYVEQTFNVTTSNYNLPIYGYYIRTTGNSPRLIALEVDPDPSAPWSLVVNDAYAITPNVTVA